MGSGEQSSPSPDADGRVLALLKRHGWNATSFQILEPGFRYWFADGGEACVAYVDTGRAWVAAGAPVGPLEELGRAAAAFVAAARAAGRRALFFATEERFVELTPDAELAALAIGEQPVWDPVAWRATLQATSSLREQLRRARAKGVTVRALSPEELADDQPETLGGFPGPPATDSARQAELRPRGPGATRQAVDQLIDRWLARHPLPPMGFLVQVHAFSHLAERRCLVAEQGGRVIGFVAAVPVYARDGWFVEDLLRDPAAPNGTAELLVDAVMNAAAAAGSRYVTLGLAPLAGRVGAWLRFARRTGSGLYDFEGLRAFKAKLRPSTWVSVFISYPHRQGAGRAVLDVLSAFARGGLFRFGLETLLRGPAVVVRLLALLLIPWTALLALVDWRRWFPARGVQLAWVAFDLVLAPALVFLGGRRRSWHTALAALVTADAVLTAVQAAAFNLRRGPGLLDLVVVAVAVAGPTLAALLLWRGRAHMTAAR
jgi:phosphatidylglycerol lysyltransferase